VTTSIVVGSILLATDELLRVEELAVATSADFVNRGRVQVDEEGTWHMLAAAGLAEKSLVRSRVTNVLEVGIRTTIRAKAVLEKVAIRRRSECLCVCAMGTRR
jgi:hypothetical protein